MIDVTRIPGAAIGDEVVLLGRQGVESIDAWDLAELTDSIPWEVLCAISARVPRVMVD
jgi:alanine racemase